MNIWLRTGLILAAVWGLAAGAIWWLHASKPTPQSVTAYLESSSLDGKTGADRDRIIHRAEDQLNDLSFEQHQEVDRSGATRRFLKSLTPGELDGFLDATLPVGFKQLMEAFNKMDPAKRKEFVSHALEEMQKHAGEGPPPGVDEKVSAKIVDQGLKSFYSDANADTKIDLAPLIEQMQRNLQSGNTN